MITKCSVCNLDPSRRAAVESALSGGVSLGDVARFSGLSKSALSRHGRHLGGAAESRPEAKDQVAKKTSAVAVRPASTAPEVEQVATPAVSLTKAELLARVELLWNESLNGLEASKEPIMLRKLDGGVLALPGDLRARSGFIRAARDVLHLGAELSGELSSPAGLNNTIINLVCVSAGPERDAVTLDVPAAEVIEIGAAGSED